MLTDEQRQKVRQENARRQREWWGKQSPEERRERRERYILNAILRREAAEGVRAE